MNLTKIVLNVLKPIGQWNVLVLAKHVMELSGVKAVNIKISNVETSLQHLTLTIEGDNIDYSKIIDTIEKFGATVEHVLEIQVVKST